jgi:hypothetical protein
MKRSAVAAIVTVGVLSTVFHAGHPAKDSLSPSGQSRTSAAQYKEIEQARARELRRQGQLLQEATNQDALRAAEHLPPPSGAERDAEQILIRALESKIP